MFEHCVKIVRITLAIIALAFVSAPVRTIGQTVETFNFVVGQDIPDANPNGIVDSRSITSTIANLADVEVNLTLSGQSGGAFLGDLYVALQHSGGFSVLLNRVGRTSVPGSEYSESDLDVTLSDDATLGDIHSYRAVLDPDQTGILIPTITGTWQPDARYSDPANVLDTDSRSRMLSQMNGRPGNGTWNLILVDLNSGNTTRLESWGLRLTSTAVPTFTVATSIVGLGQINLLPVQTAYASGTLIQATAVPNAGYGFDRWTSGASGVSPSVSLTVTSNTVLSASFKLLRTLALQTNGLGTVTTTPSGSVFLDGATATLSAIPSAGYAFTGWSGDLSGVSNPAAVVMTTNKNIIANFTKVYQLTATALTGGTLAWSPTGTNFNSGSIVTLTATPSAGYSFTGWSGDLTGSLTPASVTMTTNKSITANFVRVYQLSATALPGGTLAWSPTGTNFNSGSTVSLTATPSAGYAFSGWSGDLSGTLNPVSVTMTTNKSITATFVRVYQLSATALAGGSLAWSPTGTNCNSGSTVTLTATPAAGYAFSGWSGDLSGVSNPAAVVMTTNKNITANFTSVYQLSATALTGGTLAWSPSGTNFNSGSSVTLTATPSAGYAFSGWSGDLSGALNPALVTMTTNKSITATFVRVYQLSAIAPVGGSLACSPAGTNFNSGSTVILTATPAAGYAFNGWSGDLSGSSNPAAVLMTTNKSITGNFINVYQLAGSAQTGGTLAWSPAGTNFNSGSTVTLTATPSSGYAFSGWSGDLSGTLNPASLTMTTNKSITANFVRLCQLSATALTGGTLAWSPTGTNFNSGSTVTLTATPAAGYAFSGWSGDLSGVSNPAAVVMTTNKNITANFTSVYQLSASALAGGSLAWSPTGTNFNSGSTVTLTATPAAGYAFSGWSGDLSGTLNPASVAMTTNKSITANFTRVYQLSATALAGGTLAWSPTGTNFNSGSTVTLTATPAAGYAFSGWSGDLSGVSNPAAVVMTTNKNITANFTSVYQLSATALTGGTLAWSPTGTNFNSGSTVTLTATPSAGYAFSGWSGELSGVSNPAAVVMATNKNITANFTRVYQLSATALAGGSLAWSPTGTNFNAGSTVTLTATPSAGYAFSGWSGDLSGVSNPAAVVMATNKNITANFTRVYQLSATALAGGSLAWSPTGTNFNAGSTVTLTATPAAGYAFSGWSGDVTGTQNPVPVVMAANKVITANFALFSQLNLTSTSGGSASSNPGGTNFTPGTSVILTAAASTGYAFTGWSGDLTGSSNPATVVMDASKNIAATFVPVYQLTAVAPTGGTLAWSPTGTNFNSGSTVTLTATPSAGYAFSGWGGDLSGSLNPALVTMTTNKSITAAFVRVYQLSASALAGGSLAWLPTGTNFNSGSTVTLIPTPAAGYAFSGWSGDLSGASNPAAVVMTTNKNIIANFTKVYQLSATALTGGTLAWSPTGTNFNSGSIVTLTATPSAGYAFSGWSGDLNGTLNPASVAMTTNKIITASFVRVYQLSATALAGGSLAWSPTGTNFNSGSSVTLTATPSAGYAFSGWSGDLSGVSNPAAVVMTTNKNITANFTRVYQLSATALAGGSLAWSPTGTNFNSGSTVTLTATPAAGYAFSGWSGDLNGTLNPALVTMTTNKIITASFVRVYQLSATAPVGGSLSWSPTGTNFNAGSIVTLTATPLAGYVFTGYVFTGWTGDLVSTNNPADLVMTTNQTITANFLPIYQLNLSGSSGGWVGSLPSGSSFVSGSAVTLTATSSTGFAFVGWTGDFTGTANPALITLTSNRTIAAIFKPLRTVTVNSYGAGQVIPNGGSFPEGSVVTLEARPSPGNTLWFWFGTASGSATNFTFTVSSNITVGAYFVPLYNFMLSNSFGGTVSAVVSGVTLANDVTNSLRGYSSIALTATPSAGYSFQTWTGSLTNTNATATISLNANTSLRGVFTAIPSGLATRTQLSGAIPVSISVEGGVLRVDWKNDGSRSVRLLESGDFQNWILSTTSSPPYFVSTSQSNKRFYRVEAGGTVSGSAK